MGLLQPTPEEPLAAIKPPPPPGSPASPTTVAPTMPAQPMAAAERAQPSEPGGFAGDRALEISPATAPAPPAAPSQEQSYGGRGTEPANRGPDGPDRPIGSPATSGAEAGDTSRFELSPGATVEGRMGGLLSVDSDWRQMAETAGLQYANTRGVVNSSIAAGASYASAINAALPIATTDANNQAKAELAQLDNSLAQKLIELEQTYINERNMDTINGSIVQQLYADIGAITANADSPEEAAGQIKMLLAATDATFKFSDKKSNIKLTAPKSNSGGSGNNSPTNRKAHKEGESAGGKKIWHWNGSKWVKKTDPNQEGGGEGAGAGAGNGNSGNGSGGNSSGDGPGGSV